METRDFDITRVSPAVKEYDHSQTVARVYEIGLPPVVRLQSFVDHAIANPDDYHANEFGKLRESFQKADTIYFNAASSAAIGDCIFQLRYALIAARNTRKNFIINIHPALLKIDLDRFDLPSNVIVRPLAYKEDEAINIFAINVNGSELANLGPKMTRENRISVENRLNLSEFTEDLNGKSLRDIPHHLQPAHFTATDLYYTSWLLALGIPVTQEDLTKSFLKAEKPKEMKYDLVIAPDALGFKDRANGISLKSITVEDWKKVFTYLKTRIRQDQPFSLCIIQGKAYPEYCKEVAEAARNEGFHVEFKVTETLGDFVDVLQEAREFVGKDTGTSHLANEVALTQRGLEIREIFAYYRSGDEATPQDFGIRGIGSRGRILAFIPPHDTYHRIIIPQEALEDVATFIAT